jgi:hypothetical protein
MASMIEITLGGNTYRVPKLNFGEIEELASAAADRRIKPFQWLRTALRRADPPLSDADINGIEAGATEINLALEAVMRHSGVEIKRPGEAKPMAEAPA